jgi:CBS domain containing-hemolysin-like protein
MFTFLVILLVVVYIKLVLVTTMHPARLLLSMRELERRTKHGDVHAHKQLVLASAKSDIRSILHLFCALLLVVLPLVSVSAFGWVLGIITAVILVAFYGRLSRFVSVRRIAAKLYGFYEPRILRFVTKFPTVMKIIGTFDPSDDTSETQLGSREELQDLIDSSQGILTGEEKKLLVHGLSFAGKPVRSVMTPSAAIVTIKKSEFLGPLTLSELHKTGHSRLPVIDEDIDHVIGVLHIQSLLALDVKKSVTAEKAMEPRVFYIRDDQTLHHALAAFLRTHHHLFMVINEYRETVGLVTLEDVVEALLGRKIIDEFDSHEDKRTVALRNPHDNNEPKNHEDV